MKDLTVGFAITGSFCTHKKALEVIQACIERGYKILPIISSHTDNLDTRFFNANDFKEKLKKLCNADIIDSIVKAEPIGPKKMCDIMIILPCTGNTISKLKNSIIDDTVTMASKSHLRNNRPLVIAVSTNDGLSGCAENIGCLLNRKNYYFVPFKQDNYELKPTSLVADMDKALETIDCALLGKQVQPIILGADKC